MTTANSAAQATPAPETAAEPKAPSKMEICTKIYNEVYAQGYDLKGKTQRAVFIARAKEEAGMTQAGANTYYQNLSNAARGRGKYRYNQYVSKKSTAKTGAPADAPKEAGDDLPGASGVTKSALAEAEGQAKEVIRDLSKRWQIRDEANNIVDSFDSRDKAKNALGDGQKVHDSKAK